MARPETSSCGPWWTRRGSGAQRFLFHFSLTSLLQTELLIERQGGGALLDSSTATAPKVWTEHALASPALRGFAGVGTYLLCLRTRSSRMQRIPPMGMA